MSALLNHRISTLLLNAKAPFPSEIRDSRDMVKGWRNAQRCRLVVPADAGSPSVPADRIHHGRDDGEMG